ncbi:MAG: FecR domain-containing protein [Gammaproteobacteria bacterium]
MSRMQIVFVVAALVGGLAVPSVHAAGALGGTVMYAIGETRAHSSDGTVRTLSRGDGVVAGERVATGAGRLQLRMKDGGLVALQPNSEFGIERYDFDGTADGSENAVFRLLKGGIRAATGLIGRVNKERYSLRSTWATIGIRGTTYKARICEGDCAVPDGLYVSGGEGTIVVTNEGGELELTMGQRAFVASAESSPVPSTVEPDVADIPALDTAVDVAAVTDSNFIAGQAVFQASISGVDVVRPLAAGAGAISGSGVLSGAGRIGNTDLDGFARSGAALGSAVLSEAGIELDILNGSFNADGGLIGITGSRVNEDGVTESGALFVTNVVDVSTDGILYLGRWTEGTATAFVDGGYSASLELDASDSAHYIVAVDEIILPVTGSAEYHFNGMTTASSGTDGSLGAGVVGGHVHVDFGSQHVATSFDVDHQGLIAVQTSGFFRGGTAAFETAGNAIGAGCTAGCAASADGFLAGAGATPTRAGLSFQIEQQQRSIIGVGGFSLQAQP